MPAPDDITPATKTCSKCGEAKPVGEYRLHRSRPDGRQPYCRECQRVGAAIWYAAKASAGGFDGRAERDAARYAVNRDRIKAVAREWYAANRERALATAAAWRSAHPDRVRDRKAIRRARERGAPVVERIYRARVWERDGGRCHICGRKADPRSWHLDHIIPLSRGGEHSYRNVAVSHPTCNLRRGTSGPAQLRLAG